MLDQPGRVRHPIQVVKRIPSPRCIMASVDEFAELARAVGRGKCPAVEPCADSVSPADAIRLNNSRYCRPTFGQNMGVAYW